MNPILEEKGKKFAEEYAKYILTRLGFSDEEARNIIERMRRNLEEIARRWAEEYEKSMLKYRRVI